MKTFIKPLVASALIITSVGIYAQGYSGYKIKKIISSMDDNSDKKIGYEEYYMETAIENKDPLDENNDGYITEGEVVNEITEDLIETINEMRKAGVSEKDINKTIAQELNSAEKEAAAIVKIMDTDGDHLVEPEEYDAYNFKQFNALDKNHDGFISKDDIKRSSGYPIHLY